MLSYCQGPDLAMVVAALGTLATQDAACKQLVVDLDMTSKLQAVPAAGPAKAAAQQLLAFVQKK